jgi:predicted nucleic acid-binding protein
VKNEAFFDTDVLAAFLVHDGPGPSVVRQLCSIAFGMTSVLQAAELFAAARATELSTVESVFYAVHVLGFHFRYAEEFGRMQQHAGSGARMRDSMTAGFCRINAVPLVTFRIDAFRPYTGLAAIDAASIRPGMVWTDITIHRM